MKLVIFGIFFCLASVASGQILGPAPDNGQIIKWVASFPSETEKERIGLFEKILNIVAGVDPVVYNNPVNVYANGLDDFWIINQGDGSILHHQDGKTEKLPVFRRIYNSLPSLVGICRLKSGSFLFTDSRFNKIFYTESDGKEYRQFKINDSLERPTGIAFSDLRNEIWVVETGAHRVSVFSIDGKKIKSIGQRGTGKLQFNFPTYIWIDSSGRVYIVDSMNFRIQVLSPDGTLLSVFGQQGDATGYFARPRGIATDSGGNIYVADGLSGVVQIFDISGKFLYYFGSQGRKNGQFWMPSGIFIDKDDYIYVSDTYNSRIQVFQTDTNLIR